MPHVRFGFTRDRRLCSPVLILCLAGGLADVLVAQQADSGNAPAAAIDIVESDPAAAAKREAELITRVRQLTFEGRRAGEGYFSQDGTRMVFQSEREPGNPFFQIYLLNFETGDTARISPGRGKTTCAWIHPDGDKVLFSSTHEDRDAKRKQQEEIELRESGKQRRYSWDYDDNFDLYRFDAETSDYTNLTQIQGYDAEGSWSPDGALIAFASNRRAYNGRMTDAERKLFEIDPASMIDVYVMSADGTNVRRLTNSPGYDGGPFFSPDGRRICWRRFSEDGATAEIMTMNLDGTDQKQITHLGAMSWAPFYHPSGEYLIFTTNRHGFANFELYMVSVDGKSEPVRVTWTAGFDGLPVFTPDGKRLAWTTGRATGTGSQIFLADWNHVKAHEKLRASKKTARLDPAPEVVAPARSAAAASRQNARPEFAPADIVQHVNYLCSPELGGRLTGSEGERLATEYVAAYFESLGLEPAGDDGTWFEEFDFTSGVSPGDNNQLQINDAPLQLNDDWRPLAFSSQGEFPAVPVAFAGYGIAAPGEDDNEEYDSFVHLDVKDKWVLAFRYMPEEITPERRQHLSRAASLRFKAMLARDKGARGLILVSGPNSKVSEQLVPLQFDGSLAGTSIPVISITDDVASDWLKRSGKSLVDLQSKLDTGEMVMGFEIPDIAVSARIDIRQQRRTGRNVLGHLPVSNNPHAQMIVIGAHIDHLGTGPSSNSLARDDERGGIHFGADDNASGVAAMLEVAEYLADQHRSGKLKGQRDVLFAAWSGEELGLIGSSHFLKEIKDMFSGFHQPAEPPRNQPATNDGDDDTETNAETKDAPSGGDAPAAPDEPGLSPVSVYPYIAACLNMDMVGRLDKKLVLQGVGSSSLWRSEIEKRNAPIGLPITIQNDSYIPTDASVFFMHGVPILSAFSGTHTDYHTPRDTPNKLNYEGAARIANFMGLVARSLVMREDPPDYVGQTAPEKGQRRANLRAYLGTIPDYAESDTKGVKLSGVSKGGPAEQAGLRSADVVVELAGKKIENIYDYTYAIEALKIGVTVDIAIERGGKSIRLEVTPGSRD